MKRRIATAALAASMLAALGSAVPAGAGQTATKADETLVRYLTKGKLKADGNISYKVVCAVDCKLKLDVALLLPGKDFSPKPIGGNVAAGNVISDQIKPNGPLLKRIRDKIGRVKLRSTITATDLVTGEVDRDNRVFKLKR